MYKKKTWLITLLVIAVVLLPACEKKLQPITGSVHLSPIPTSTSTPTPSPTPLSEVPVNEDTVEIKVIGSEEGLTKVSLKVKNEFTFSNGKVFNNEHLNQGLVWNIVKEYALSLHYNVPEGLAGHYALYTDKAIVGIKEGLYGKSREELAELSKLFNDMLNGTAASQTEVVIDCFETSMAEAWRDAAYAIIYNCITNFADYADQGYMGAYTKADLSDEKLHVAYTMSMWGFGEFEENSKIFKNTRGKSFDTGAGVYPEIEDFVEEVQYLYSNDAKDFYVKEVKSSDSVSLLERAENLFISDYCMYEKNVSSQYIETRIEGIKLEANEIIATFQGAAPEDIYSIFDFIINE